MEPPTPDAGGAPINPPAADTWNDYRASHPEPSKLEPYSGAKSWPEAFDQQGKRLADAQTAARRPAGLPPRPEDGAPPEAFTAWRQAHGLPDKPEGYDIQRPESVPESQWDPERLNRFRAFAHEHGISPELVKKLAEYDAKEGQDAHGAAQQREAQAAEAMRAAESKEMGVRFGTKLDGVLKDVQSVAQSLKAPDGAFDPASPNFWGVEALTLFNSLLGRIPRGEDGTMRHMGQMAATGYDKLWAKASLRKGHPDYDARTNPSHPRHKEVNDLANQAYAIG